MFWGKELQRSWDVDTEFSVESFPDSETPSHLCVCVCVCLYVSMCVCVCLCVCRLQGFGGSELLSSFVRRSCSVPRRPSHRQLLKNTPRRKYKKYLATAEELYLKDIPKGWKPFKYDISLSNRGLSVIRTGKAPGSPTNMDGKVF